MLGRKWAIQRKAFWTRAALTHDTSTTPNELLAS